MVKQTEEYIQERITTKYDINEINENVNTKTVKKGSLTELETHENLIYSDKEWKNKDLPHEIKRSKHSNHARQQEPAKNVNALQNRIDIDVRNAEMQTDILDRDERSFEIYDNAIQNNIYEHRLHLDDESNIDGRNQDDFELNRLNQNEKNFWIYQNDFEDKSIDGYISDRADDQLAINFKEYSSDNSIYKEAGPTVGSTSYLSLKVNDSVEIENVAKAGVKAPKKFFNKVSNQIENSDDSYEANTLKQFHKVAESPVGVFGKIKNTSSKLVSSNKSTPYNKLASPNGPVVSNSPIAYSKSVSSRKMTSTNIESSKLKTSVDTNIRRVQKLNNDSSKVANKFRKTSHVTRKASKTAKTATKTAKNSEKAVRKTVTTATKVVAKTTETAVKTGATVATQSNPVGWILDIVLLVIAILIAVWLLYSSYQDNKNGIFFGQVSTDESGTELNEQEYLSQMISNSIAGLVADIQAIRTINLRSNGGNFDIIVLDKDGTDTEEITETNIQSLIYSNEEYYSIIESLFHVIVLFDYDGETTSAERDEIYINIWDRLTVIGQSELPPVYCHDGETEEDGKIHADISSCPHHSKMKKHDDDTSTPYCSCDYKWYECLGHGDDVFCSTGQMSEPCSNSKEHKACNGFYICKGHTVLCVSISVQGFYDVLDYYWGDRIHALENQIILTKDDKEELADLKSKYEVASACYSVIEEISPSSGEDSGGSTVNLDGVELTDITAYACKFVGNKYVWGGSDPHTGADCSGFVRYVYKHFGIDVGPHKASGQCAYHTGKTVPNLASAKPGDLIFYAKPNKPVHHVAMYLGNKKIVHAACTKLGITISSTERYYGKNIYKIKRYVD